MITWLKFINFYSIFIQKFYKFPRRERSLSLTSILFTVCVSFNN